MALIRCGRWVLPLLAAACSPSPTAVPKPVVDAASTSSEALPPVPERRGPIRLHVSYPPADAVVQVHDSSFLLGSAGTGDARLTINGIPVRVWPNGAWLAYLPFPPDSVARFEIEARNATDSASLVYQVRRKVEATAPVPGTTVWLDTLSLSPRGRVWLRRDEYLPLSARASTGALVRLLLPDGTVVPLVAQPELGEVPEGVRVFGDGSSSGTWSRDSYSGVLRGRSVGPDPGPMFPQARYAVLPLAMAAESLPWVPPDDTSWATVEAISGVDTARARWPLQVSLLDSLPIVGEIGDDSAHAGLGDSITTGRALPGGTYAWFFPAGTRAEVAGRRNDELRLRLSTGAEAWVSASKMRPLPAGVPSREGTVGSVVVVPSAGYVTLRVPVTQRLPFRVIEGERTLALRLYGAVGDVNWMRYGPTDSLVRRLGWEQSTPDEVTLDLELARPVWGYRTRWSGNDLLLDVRRPPAIDRGHPLSGRLIAVDAGHPPGGAVGPTGLREAEANLAVAFELRRMLESAGARVLMTRTDDRPLDLWRRPAMAESANADVLVSIHNNALPDGINPFVNNGTSVYYNQPRSIPLARDIQRELIERLGLRDLGFGRGDLALVRSTWMPSVLTEGLFMTLPDQEAALRTRRGQQRYASAVMEGLRRFLDERAQDGSR